MAAVMRWISINGRIGRRRFWLATIGSVLLFLFFEKALRGVLPAQSVLILYVPLLLILRAAFARRLHDRNKSAWWTLLLLIPILGPLWLFIDLGLRKGIHDSNRYGPPPSRDKTDYLVVG